MKQELIFKCFKIFLYLSFFVSAISRESVVPAVLLSILATSLGLIFIFRNGEVDIPKIFLPFSVYVLILHILIFFAEFKINPFVNAVIFTEALFYWLIFHNLEDGFQVAKSILLNFLIFYGIIYIASILFNINLTKAATLIFAQESPSRSYFINILSSLMLIFIPTLKWKDYSLKRVLLICLAICFLILSNSRSGYLAFAFALAYLLFKGMGTFQSKFLGKILIFLTGVIFIIVSRSRTTIFDRPYFFQSIQSLPNHIFGVGMGNFWLIANEIRITGVNILSTSIYTHNILLESLSGVGIFSILFFIFLVNIFYQIWKAEPDRAIAGSMLLILLINFMLNTSYTIPLFLWSLFIVLGAFQNKKASARSF